MIPYAQPDWLTVTACPAMVSVPVLAVPVLAATLYLTTPLLVPDAPCVIASHGALLVAVHVHEASLAVTLTT